MLLSPSTLLAVLASASFASATFGHQKFTWGCDKDTKDKAPAPVKNDCSDRGSFFTIFNGHAVCCSDKTRNPPPKKDDCPHSWSWNKRSGCCIPPKEICGKDCGEGYTFNKNKMKCEPNQPGKCGGNGWWHERSKECCDKNPPPPGNCPPGITCPNEWHWDKKGNKCKPDHPRSPEPDCDDWNAPKQCCGNHGPKPSKGPVSPPGGGPKPPAGGPQPPAGGPKPPPYGGNGGFGIGVGVGIGGIGAGAGAHIGSGGIGAGAGAHVGNGIGAGAGAHFGGHKRNADRRRSAQLSFPQSETDKLYCPGLMHACTVNSVFGGEWSYECIDVASELESCGGCASSGEGQDCTKIPHAISVGCDMGVCQVNTCQTGFKPSGTACIAA